MFVERLARGAAFALLAVALYRAIVTREAGGVGRLHAALGGAVSPQTRDSLAALARTGTGVSWSGAPTSLAAMAEPVREPTGGVRLSVVAASPVLVRDALGQLDSVDAGGGTVTTASTRGALTVREGATVATTVVSPSPALGRVLVFGRAGWESKFVIAALEEQGWLVDASLSLGGGLRVTQGAPAMPIIARHAAVVVLDSTVTAWSAIERFVRSGGGLVMAGEGAAAATPALRALTPARGTRAMPATTRSFVGTDPFNALPLVALTALREDAVVLASRDAVPAVAARRLGAGRVVQMGYAETWRWRMEGEEGSVGDHRRYWSRLVGQVAATRDSGAVSATGENGAPLALAVHALGPAVAAPTLPAGITGPALPPWLAPLLLALLLGEWASRRTRGAA